MSKEPGDDVPYLPMTQALVPSASLTKNGKMGFNILISS